MPVQRFGMGPVERPSGLVPPVVALHGVTELRVHGVGGSTPEDLLGDLAPLQVSGDRIAGFYRTADLPRNDHRQRHVEAYSWGGLTSRSGSRALWVLLFPFALANVAGWMCSRRTHASRWRFWGHRALVRWAALGLTVNVLLFTAATAMDLVAYQCGGQPACAGNTWALRFLSSEALTEHPGRRIALGALLPLAVIVVLALLTMRSIGRYEQVRPPFAGQQEPDPHPVSAAGETIGLADPDFWNGWRSTARLGLAHVAAGLAFVALAVVHTAQTTVTVAGFEAANPLATRQVAWLAAGAALVLAVVVVAFERCGQLWSGLSCLAALVAVAAAAVFALIQPALPAGLMAGSLPGMRNTINISLIGILAPVVGLLLLQLLVWAGPKLSRARPLSGRQRLDGLGAEGRRHESGAGAAANTFRWGGPFVALTVAVLALNAVLVGTMIRIADWLGTVSTAQSGGAPQRSTLYLFPAVGGLSAYLTLGPLVLAAILGIREWRRVRVAGREEAAQVREHYRKRDRYPRPIDETAWQYTTAPLQDPVEPSVGVVVKRWAGRVARARRTARIPRETDWMLTLAAALAVVGLACVEYLVWIEHKQPWAPWMVTAGSWFAAWLPVVVILLLRRGWRDLSSRRRIGIVWDVLTFWPRAYHPLAPPSYAERAVPELQRRLWRLYDQDGHIVVAAHSQGTVLAAAALLQPLSPPPVGEEGVAAEAAPQTTAPQTTAPQTTAPQTTAPQAAVQDRVALVTFGSPLRTLYGWAFPAYFNETVLGALAPGGTAGLSSWRNRYYQTDYIGRDVGIEAVDEELPDPVTCWYVYGQDAPAPGRHSGYWTDPAVWACVDEAADELTAALRAHELAGAADTASAVEDAARVHSQPSDAAPAPRAEGGQAVRRP